MVKTAIEARVQQNTKDIDAMKSEITVGMDKMVSTMNGLRDDMSERSERYIKIQTDHALEDSTRFGALELNTAARIGRLETRIAMYIGMGMCFVAFAKDIIIGIASATGK